MKADGWIELGRRFTKQPEEGLCVLCAAPGYERPVIAARFRRDKYDGGGWEWQDECGDVLQPAPTIYMPLPELPCGYSVSAEVTADRATKPAEELEFCADHMLGGDS